MEKAFKRTGSKSAAPSAREQKHADLARRAAAAGIVLLKNNGLLPLDPSRPVALLGAGAGHTIKGGTGSGDVNNRASVTIREGLRCAGARVTSEEWMADYDVRYDAARLVWRDKVLADAATAENKFEAYAANPFSLPDGRPVGERDVDGAAAAVYVLSRISGEGKDRRLEKGDYYLSDRERNDLLTLDKLGVPVVLALNAGGSVELTDLLGECANIGAVLQLSQLGQQGGEAVADILFGKASPEGKLTATWARRYEDYPGAGSFGSLNGDVTQDTYREGVLVGYRGFEAFGIEPLFAFGHGLSYTTFSMELAAVRTDAHGVGLDVAVVNPGAGCSRRRVVQAYLSFPAGNLAKEPRRLAGFAKTQLLGPGEAQTVTVCIPAKQLASFSPERRAWIVETGRYGVWIGAGSAGTSLCAQLCVSKETVLERTTPVCPVQQAFDELTPPERTAVSLADVPTVPFEPQAEPAPSAPEANLAEGELGELIPLLHGNVTKGASMLGSAGRRVPGPAGETSEALEETRGVPSLIMADGPAGLRLRQRYQVERATGDVIPTGVLGSLENGFLEAPPESSDADTYYQFCTAFPVGTALAQTWDTQLMFAFGEAVAREMEEFSVHLLLAPGMNIQRNPLCGRNFEYYSEDPLLSGLMAAAVTRGVQSRGGCGVAVKHFACNNQEDARMSVNACVSERALREIYLRGFEIAVKLSSPAALMTSYNLINGVHAANSRDLCTVVARGEWGFGGVIMSDWNTTVPADGSKPWKCAWAGNDVIMPGNLNDEADIRHALASGELSECDIRASAGRVIELARRFAEKRVGTP